MSVVRVTHLMSTSGRQLAAALLMAVAVLSRRVWLVLAVMMVLLGGTHLLLGAGLTWHYVQTGAGELFSGRWLHVYADHPEIQMGPLTLVVSAPFALLHPAWLGRILAMVALSGVGLLCLHQVTLLAGRQVRDDRPLILFLGLLFVPAWMEVAVHWEHPDDAMALLCVIVGLRCARKGTWAGSAVLLGLSVDFKPWALAFAPLVLLAARNRWVLSVSIWVAVVVVAWAPFVLADHRTVSRISAFMITNDRASVLRVFGVDTAGTPSWCRAAQVVGGVAVALWLVARGRWPAVVLAVVAFRMLLDPGTKNYYDAGLVLAAVLFDLCSAHVRWPRATIITVVLVYVPSYLLLHLPEVRGVLRAIGLLTLLGLSCWGRSLADAAETDPPLLARQSRPGHRDPGPRR